MQGQGALNLFNQPCMKWKMKHRILRISTSVNNCN